MNIDDITYRINGAIFEVNRKLGAGFLEKVYQNALMVELAAIKLKAESQVPIVVKYKGVDVGEYFADIVVENQVILELKAVDSLQKIHEAQLLNYLKATGYKIGLLIYSSKGRNQAICVLATDTHRRTQTFYSAGTAE